MKPYHNKYIKYKRKYINLKRTISEESIKYLTKGTNKSSKKLNEKFYFVHITKNSSRIIKILKSGELLPGARLPAKASGLNPYIKELDDTKFDPLSAVYFNIHFEDLNNLPFLQPYSIILSSKILDDYDVCFNDGWYGDYPRTVCQKMLKKKGRKKVRIKTPKFGFFETPIPVELKEIKEYLKNPGQRSYKDPNNPMHLFWNHEVLVEGSIELKKYLLAIVCLKCTHKYPNNIKKIKKLLKKYPKVKLITDDNSMPTIKELQMVN